MAARILSVSRRRKGISSATGCLCLVITNLALLHALQQLRQVRLRFECANFGHGRRPQPRRVATLRHPLPDRAGVDGEFARTARSITRSRVGYGLLFSTFAESSLHATRPSLPGGRCPKADTVQVRSSPGPSQSNRADSHLGGYRCRERPEVLVTVLHGVDVTTERTVRRLQVEHRLARFLGHRHQAAIVLECGEALGVVFGRGSVSYPYRQVPRRGRRRGSGASISGTPERDGPLSPRAASRHSPRG